MFWKELSKSQHEWFSERSLETRLGLFTLEDWSFQFRKIPRLMAPIYMINEGFRSMRFRGELAKSFGEIHKKAFVILPTYR